MNQDPNSYLQEFNTVYQNKSKNKNPIRKIKQLDNDDDKANKTGPLPDNYKSCWYVFPDKTVCGKRHWFSSHFTNKPAAHGKGPRASKKSKRTQSEDTVNAVITNRNTSALDAEMATALQIPQDASVNVTLECPDCDDNPFTLPALNTTLPNNYFIADTGASGLGVIAHMIAAVNPRTSSITHT